MIVDSVDDDNQQEILTNTGTLSGQTSKNSEQGSIQPNKLVVNNRRLRIIGQKGVHVRSDQNQ